jgi:hypothetical protein
MVANRGILILASHGNTVTGNTFICHNTLSWDSCVELNGVECTGNTVTGNTFNLNGSQSVYQEINGATGNTIGSNTVNRT